MSAIYLESEVGGVRSPNTLTSDAVTHLLGALAAGFDRTLAVNIYGAGNVVLARATAFVASGNPGAGTAVVLGTTHTSSTASAVMSVSLLMLAHAGGTAQTVAVGYIEGGVSLRVLAFASGSWLLAPGATVSVLFSVTASYSTFSTTGTPPVTSVQYGPHLLLAHAGVFSPGRVSVPALYPNTGYLVDADGVTYRSTFAISVSQQPGFVRGTATGFTVPVATYSGVLQTRTVTCIFGVYGTMTLTPTFLASFSFTQVAGTVGSYTMDFQVTAVTVAPILLPL